MVRSLVVSLLIALVAASPARAAVGDAAPEIRPAAWINAAPGATAKLRGEVSLVEFWTFACWNCRNVEPHVRSWHERYATRGLHVIGVHSPELPQERVLANVEQYVKEHHIPYPVAVDDDFSIWSAFGNHAWPTWYLVDRTGTIRFRHVGEGGYEETEAAIERLLAEH